MNGISVIIPIFGVEKFIERCAVSLMEQTLCSVEYIFVDDATPDGSIDILQEVLNRYPQRKQNSRIIHHEVNKGLPAARNTGLQYANGKYVFHCDSDDFLEKDGLEKLYTTAETEEADIVWCDFYLSFEKKERYMHQPDYPTSFDALKAMLSGAMKYNVWNKLVKRSLYEDNEISFPDGYGMGEDMTMLKLFAHAEKVAYVHQAFYHYVQLNTGAFSKTYSDIHLQELRHNVDDVLCYLDDSFGDSLEKEYAFFKLDVKFPFLISSDNRKYKLWCNWYTEADRFIGENPVTSRRSMLLQKMASKHHFWFVWLYFQVIYNFIYRLLFR